MGVSIVLAVNNGEAYLPQCLKSIADQTFVNWELIAVNDGSTDGSQAILEAFFRDPRHGGRLITQERKGTGAAINAALEQVRFPYIARMDADDEMLPERLALQFAFLEEHPEIDAVGGHIHILSEHGEILGQKKNPLKHKRISHLIRLCQFPIVHPTLMIKSELLKKVRYREILLASVDLPLWLDLKKAGCVFANVDAFVLRKRQHRHSITTHPKIAQVVAIRTNQIAIEHFLNDGNFRKAFEALANQIYYLIRPNYFKKDKINN